MHDLRQRVDRLEKQSRLYRGCFLLSTIALCGAVLVGAKSNEPALLNASKINLWGSNGQLVMEIGQDGSGNGAIVINSSGGERRLEIRAYEEAGSIAVKGRRDSQALASPVLVQIGGQSSGGTITLSPRDGGATSVDIRADSSGFMIQGHDPNGKVSLVSSRADGGYVEVLDMHGASERVPSSARSPN